jgi:ubiquinone/menaquinone biosynthesis C-methylase UbiE
MTDLYTGFADRYDLFFTRFGEHAAALVEFYRRLFAENRVQRVLDCACGTGHDLLLFHSLGCEVVGTDISEAMLAQARKNLAACGLEIPLLRVDYRELPGHFDRQFDAVMCLSTSIAHMPTEAEVLRAVGSMRGVLRDGGLLVLSQGTSDRQWRDKPRFVLAVNTPDFSRLFVMITTLSAGRAMTSWTSSTVPRPANSRSGAPTTPRCSCATIRNDC